MSTVQRKCRCGALFMARKADVKRGWGRFCSKSCKATQQEVRTGQYRAMVGQDSNGLVFPSMADEDIQPSWGLA